MPWFNVDDGFHSHPKAIAAGPAAIGLWTIAGSWSAKHLTNGFIPRQVLVTLTSDPNRARLAKRLVSVGLWEQVGEDGWQFHEWNDDGRNPTPAQVKAAKAANRDRQARFRERQRNAVSNASVTPSVTRESQRPLPSTPYIGADVVTDPVRGRHSRPVDNPSRFANPNPGEGAAARHPSARPPSEAAAAAGLNGAPPLRGQAVTDLAATIRQAITGDDAHGT